MGRKRRRGGQRGWALWARRSAEVVAPLTIAFLAMIAALGWLADAVAGTGPWWRLLLFAGGVLAVGSGATALLRGWLVARRWLADRATSLPAAVAVLAGAVALWVASGPAFHAQFENLRALVGGRAE